MNIKVNTEIEQVLERERHFINLEYTNKGNAT